MVLATTAPSASVWKQFAGWRGCRTLPLPAAGQVAGPHGHGSARWRLLISTGCSTRWWWGGGAAPQPFHPHHPLGVWQLPPAAMQPPTPRARSRSRSRPLPGAAPTREPGQGEPSVAGDGCHRLGVWRRRSSAAHSRHSAPLQSPPVCKQPRLWPSMSLFFPRASPLARAPGCPPGPGWRLPPLRFWITFAGGSVAGVHAAARELLGRTSGPREPAPIPRLGSGSANCH